MRNGGQSQSAGEERNGYVVEFETHVEAAVKLLPPPLAAGGTTVVLLFTDYFQGLERWHERVGSNDSSERRDSTRETQKKEERETPSSRHRNTETFSRDTEDESLENPGHPALGRQKAASTLPRHRDDNDAGRPSTPLSHGRIHLATITGPVARSESSPRQRPGGR
jgi:hypothetical protein